MRKGILCTICLGLALFLALASCSPQPSSAQERIRDRIKQRFGQLNNGYTDTNKSPQIKIAGLDVAVSEPKSILQQPAPLVIFSHGFHGSNEQSKFIMQALSDAGYLVIAPNHQDARENSSMMTKPEVSFRNADEWTDHTYKNRIDDIKRLLLALNKDPEWKNKIDWTKVALAGHSLGGYTALACGGAWESCKLPGISAVLALSPYSQPFVLHGSLPKMDLPVMYQTGTRDFGIAPFVKQKDGAFDKTSSPAYLVVLDKAGHLAWTNFQRDEEQKNAINYYCVSFLDKYLKRDANAKPEKKVAGVTELEVH
jgi:predicted dienelactone hydrolase